MYPDVLTSSASFDEGFRISSLYHASEAPSVDISVDAKNTASDQEFEFGGNCSSSVANASLIHAAHRLLQPLMLRRLKRDVLIGELPPKVWFTFFLFSNS